MRGLFRIDEGERKGPDPQLGSKFDRCPVRTCNPHRRVGLLARLRHNVSARERKRLAFVAGIWGHRHHVGDLLPRLDAHVPLLLRRDPEATQLHASGAFPDTEFDPSSGDQVEGGDLLGDPGRVVVVGRGVLDAVPDADVLGPCRAGGEKHFGR